MEFFSNEIHLTIPRWVTDINSFRQWADTPGFPERADIWWIRGEIWADLNPEELFTHNLVRGEDFSALANLVKSERMGRVFMRGAFLFNRDADVAGKPDALFSAIGSGRLQYVDDGKGGCNELQGTPDWVLEVVSDSSVVKDTVTLNDVYWRTGVEEYWLVDARDDRPRFEMFSYTPKGYRRTPGKHGWLKSRVFGESFRLTVDRGQSDWPAYTLDIR
jgi:Uma2 family endonuclease